MKDIYLGRQEANRLPAYGFAPQAEMLDPAPIVWGANSGHLLTVAPTGAGKTRRVLVPALLSCNRPAIILDPKAEIHAMSSSAREAQGFRSVLVSLDDQASVNGGLNPMDLVRFGALGSDDALSLANLLVGAPQGNDPFWDRSAGQVVGGMIELVGGHFPSHLRTLATVRRLLLEDPALLAKTIALSLHGDLSAPLSRAAANLLKVAPERTRSSILATLDAHLAPLASPAACRAMQASLVSVDEIVRGAPVTIYITVPPAKLHSHRAILRLWIGSLLMVLMRRAPGLYADPTLLLIDETAQLGPMGELETAITLMRGYGMQVWTVWQDLDQIRATYPGCWRTIINNSGALQSFGVRNAQAAAELETLFGIERDLTRIGAAFQVLKLGADPAIIAGLPDPIMTGATFAAPTNQPSPRTREIDDAIQDRPIKTS
jgi:type IV secretion system protein VirD4